MSTNDTKSKSQESKHKKRSKKESSISSVNNLGLKLNKTKSTKSKQLSKEEVEQRSQKIVDGTPKQLSDRSPTKERNSVEISRDSSVLSTEDAESRISTEKPNHVSFEKLNNTPNADMTTVETPNFKPPRNFVRKETQECSSISSLFNESNLEGKQIWYFTVPSTLDISPLESVSSSAIINEEPVFKKNGDEYIFTNDFSETQNYNIIVPDAAKDGYKVVSRPVSRILSLQQIVAETKVKSCKTDPGASIITASKSEIKKEQPNGLKMRFHPLGFFNKPPEIIGDDFSEQRSTEEVDSLL
ncbi:hypothetical protein OnM2_023062 [Erysiphe neolycopersici]|uniref:Uncharacterized protein n=1 Tax=Erysiphe neolycopersici TaxID=212602 RepID=A0A420I239_9PEZI|nr:hypothetical protein OnM2_023062 [Erysiphe neolycopersici]